MSFFTCSCALPQKEHFNCPLSSPNLNIISPRLLLLLFLLLSLAFVQNAVDQTVFSCLICRHVIVPIGIPFDLIQRLASVLVENLIDPGTEIENLLGLDLNLTGLTLGTAQGLVDHNPGVGQGKSLALCSGAEQQGTHARSHPHTDCGNISFDVLDGIVDCQSRRDNSAWAVDIQVNVLVGILRL